MSLKIKQLNPVVRGKLSYFKTLAAQNSFKSYDTLQKAALLSGFRSYHDLSKTIRTHFDLSVEDFISGL